MGDKKDIREKIISIEDLEEIRKRHKDQKIVFTVGCYDILHHGHMYFFNDCAKLGDILIVGLAKDSTMKILKGPNRPINHEQNRVHVIAGLESVDYAILNEEMVGVGRKDEYLSTKVDFKLILEKLRPDVFVLGEDTISSQNKKEMCKELGIEVAVVTKDIFQGTNRISSTQISEALKDSKEI